MQPRILRVIHSKESPWYNPVFEAYSAFIGRPQQVALDTLLPAPEFGRITLHGPLDQATLKGWFIWCMMCAAMMRCCVKWRDPGEFDKLRKNYVERREWSSLYVMCDDAAAATLLHKLVLTPFITRRINVFLTPLLDTQQGRFLFWSKPPCLKAGTLPF